MGGFDHHWRRRCRTGDFYSSVSRTVSHSQQLTQTICLDSSWLLEEHGGEPPSAV